MAVETFGILLSACNSELQLIKLQVLKPRLPSNVVQQLARIHRAVVSVVQVMTNSQNLICADVNVRQPFFLSTSSCYHR